MRSTVCCLSQQRRSTRQNMSCTRTTHDCIGRQLYNRLPGGRPTMIIGLRYSSNRPHQYCTTLYSTLCCQCCAITVLYSTRYGTVRSHMVLLPPGVVPLVVVLVLPLESVSFLVRDQGDIRRVEPVWRQCWYCTVLYCMCFQIKVIKDVCTERQA